MAGRAAMHKKLNQTNGIGQNSLNEDRLLWDRRNVHFTICLYVVLLISSF